VAAGRKTVDLRDALARDAPRLTELVHAAYGPWVERIGATPRPMKDDYAEVVRSHRVTVAEHGREIVGLIVFDLSDGMFVIDNVAVDPRHHGSGVGRALLEHAEHVALGEGRDAIYLYTNERMTENLELYERIGYVEYERRGEGPARVVYLRKRLISAS
jgi:ribosomal protein S18 acetylase RimI-like enzyme